MSAVAVLDIGKTNVKLSSADPDGRLRETLAMANAIRSGPPYAHHDLEAMETWVLDGLAALNRRHPISAVVTTAHGSGGVLIGEDGPALPMIDYEQATPPAIDALYREIVGPFRDRGSPVMLGAAHLARQMLWMEQVFPEAFAAARYFLAAPQYWSWRLSGVASSEVTSLGAQSHLWSAADRRPAAIVADRGWGRLLPEVRPAWVTLGSIRPAVAARTGLDPAVRVINGIHDSSVSLYRFQAADLTDFALVSTGTWIVAVGEDPSADLDTERPGFSVNVDIFGRPVPCWLAMGGREFDAVASGATGLAKTGALVRLVATGTRALPAFGADDGLFPGSARRGTLEGPLAGNAELHPSLAVLYAALLTDRCIAGFGVGTLVLDGPFTRDPAFGALVAALNPSRRVLVDGDHRGPATGCALLTAHEARRGPALHSLQPPPVLDIPGLLAYRDAWVERARSRTI